MPALIGYYRYKLDNVLAGQTKTIKLYNGATLLATKTVTGKEFCTNQKLIKWLCKDGQYRFYSFSNLFQTSDNPTLLGKTNELITNLLTSQTNSKNIGYKNERTIDLTSDILNENELLVFSDIYTSPRIYLYIGSTTDTAQDWVQVEVINSENIVNRLKRKFGNIQLSLKLPENFTIKMI